MITAASRTLFNPLFLHTHIRNNSYVISGSGSLKSPFPIHNYRSESLHQIHFSVVCATKGFGPSTNQKKNKKKKNTKNLRNNNEEDNEEEEEEDGIIPEIVTNRMINRMGLSVGIPLASLTAAHRRPRTAVRRTSVMARTRRTAYVVRELPADQPDEGVADQGDEDIDETVAQAGRVRPTASARRQRGAGKDISQMMGYRRAEEGPSEEAVEEGHAVEEGPHVQAQAQAHVEEGPHVQAQAPVGFPGGPVDTAVLASYGGHVASILWDGSRDREDLKMVNHGQLVLDFDVDPFVRDYVVAAGLGQLRVTAQPKIDKGIQIAFLERWHQETSSFHLPVGEMSITLDDVDQLLHIPVSGALFAGRELTRQWKRNEAVQLCVDLLGVTAEEINAEFSINRGNNIRFEFLKTRVYPQRLADGNYVMAARAYMLYLVGTTLFASKAGTLVRAWYLCLFRDMDIIGQWSWGAMALAHLYRELTESTRIETKQLAGYSSLLQSWIHEHFQGVSFGGRQPNPRYVEGLPRACRWTFSPASGNVVEYRHILDRMTDMDVTWDPYSSHRVARPFCHISLYRGFIRIGANMVPYLPDRVMRQFDNMQAIPANPPSLVQFPDSCGLC